MPVECLVATRIGTFERLRMCDFMPPQMLQSNSALPANRAMVRSFVRVQPKVSFQMNLFSECFLALITLKRLQSLMHCTLMFCEGRRSCKSFIAAIVVTKIRLTSRTSRRQTRHRMDTFWRFGNRFQTCLGVLPSSQINLK